MKPKTILAFNESQSKEDRQICETLEQEINSHLPEAESKIWHAHPVWFLDGNPTVGYNKMKECIRLMFWSGADFNEAELKVCCFELGVDYEDLGGNGRADNARELVALLQRQGRLPELIAYMDRERP